MTTIAPTDTIDTQELRRLRQGDPDLRILDVRSGGEFEVAHIPGSYNVPLGTLQEHVRDLADVEHPVVLVCQSGGRATRAHESLAGAGKAQLHILEGGMNAWLEAGGDVFRPAANRWAMDRQIRLVAGGIALAGIVASVFVPKAKWVGAGVAAGLVHSAVTNTCAMASVLAKLPYNRGASCDIAGVLADLEQTTDSTTAEPIPQGGNRS